MTEAQKISTLRDIGKVLMCKRVLKSQTSNYGEIPFFKISTFGGKADTFITDDLYSEYKQKYSHPKKGDVLISAAGTVGKTVIYDGRPSYFQDSNIVWIDNDESRILNSYLYYFYQTEPWLTTKGSTINRIYNDDLRNIEITYPNLLVQKNIARILSDLDKKIELNNLIKAELEAMAKLIYDYWFVQFDFPDAKGKPYKSSGGKMVYNEALKREIPDGWGSGNIMHLTNLLGGGTPKTTIDEYWNGLIPFFTPADAESSVFSLKTKENITEKGLESCSSKLYSKGTVFITARGTVGKINIASCDMAMNQSCYALQGKEDIGSEFVYFYAKELIQYVKSKASGSIFKALVTNDFKFTELTVPPVELIINFAKVVESSFEKILLNRIESQRLTELRDWLLPMLMNGQVTVKN